MDSTKPGYTAKSDAGPQYDVGYSGEHRIYGHVLGARHIGLQARVGLVRLQYEEAARGHARGHGP